MTDKSFSIACPVPTDGRGERILLAHGEGARLTRRLIEDEIVPTLASDYSSDLGDAAVLAPVSGPAVMTTDSFVVSPLFFPGGDIGSLAVYGTVNDLAVAGAKPLWLSLGLILEEGLEVEVLRRVLASVARAARRTGVQIVTGDTKVVPRGKADRIFINTAGVGELLTPAPSGPSTLGPGDEILVTGPIGCHGTAVMASREHLDFDPPPRSDSGPLVSAVAALRDAGVQVRALRDATRGGLAAVLHEWADACELTLSVDESRLPVTDAVRGVCEVLGLDAVHVACEGTMAVAVVAGETERALEALRGVPESAQAVAVGRVTERRSAPVVVRRLLGHDLPLDEPMGAPLPRIC